MGISKKIGIGLGIVILVIVGIAIYESFLIEEEGLTSMTDQELSKMSINWNYEHLLKNIDDYKGNIIYVEGKITSSQPDMNFVGIEPGCSGVLELDICDTIFIETETNYLIGNYITGYGTVIGLGGMKSQTSTGEFIQQVPYVKEIKIRCTNC